MSTGKPETWPTQILVETGQLLRTLTPPTFATLLLVNNETVRTQVDIADTIGRSRSSISQYLDALEQLPHPLVEQRQIRYRTTAIGEKTVSYLGGMMDRLGVDVYSIDWDNDEEMARVEDCLTPLSNSRDAVPFFILDSLSERSDLSLGRPLPVELVDVVDDVNARQQARGESSSRRQVRRRLQKRFEPGDTIEFDGETISLTEKGQEHAQLLDQFAQLLFEWKGSDSSASEAASTSSDTGVQSKLGVNRSRSGRSQTLPSSGEITRQHDPRGFLGGQTFDTLGADVREPPASLPRILPMFCLPDAERDDEQPANSQLEPILPITTQTLGELAEQVDHLLNEHTAETRIEPYLIVQMESGLYPVSPAQLSLSESPEDG